MTQFQPYDPMSALTQLSDPSPMPISVPFSPVADANTRAFLTAAQPGSAAGPLSFLGKAGDWLGKNGQTIGTVADLLSQGMQAYLGLKQLSMAKDAFNFEKKAFKTNLRNSVQSYNTQMNDRITGRYYATEEERQAALQAAQLSDSMSGKGG